jgi:membrane associated rhomboid family serine protease
MTNNMLEDIKFKVFKSGNPVFLYMGINIAIFIVVSLVSVICFFTGYQGLIESLVNKYLAFPSNPALWLTRFYTPLSYQFFHADIFHILFNMLWLYWMGRLFLDFSKPRQFHFVYIGGGIVGAILYALMYNLMPAFQSVVSTSTVIGSSAAVMAIFVAIATLVPDYTIRLLLIGNVKLKYLVLAYIVLDIIAMKSYNAGGSIAHLGGALFGFIYIKLLQSGTDLSAIFKKKPKLRVVRNEAPKKNTAAINQREIDAILDKISKTGYDKLTREEKEILFNASKN